MRRLALIAGFATIAAPALAQQTTVTSGAATMAPSVNPTVKTLLADSYEIKAAFADVTGGAYMVLQKTTSAFLCHSNPTPTCEKLN